MCGFHRWDPTTERIAPGHRANSSVHKTHPKEHGGAKNRPDSIDEWSQTCHFHTYCKGRYDAVCHEHPWTIFRVMTLIDLLNPQQSAAQCDYKRVSSLPHILDSFWQNHQGHWQICLTFDTFPPSKCSMGATKCRILSNDFALLSKTTSKPK